MSEKRDDGIVTRRSFLAGSAGVAASLLATESLAQAKKPAPKAPVKPAAKPAPKPAVKPEPPKPAVNVPTVNVAVIGLSQQGRDLLASLGRAPGANVAAVCDTYKPYLNRAKTSAPNAQQHEDYRKILEDPKVQAVFIATPTHLHKDIALAAIQAGKAVYLESPMAHTVEDARAIAQAGKASKQVFQVGNQYRGNPQHHHVQKFIHSAALGVITTGRSQWHKKTSWRRAASDDTQNRLLNWRLDPAISPGLIGEQGIHSLDIANWFTKMLPASVTGFGSILKWGEDGRKVADTVQVVLEYPNGVRFFWDGTLTSSHDGSYEVFNGTDSSVILRDQQAWMFKEADAPLLGWEVYARKEEYGSDTGICLVADASKQLAEGKIPGKEKPVNDPGKSPLFFSIESFLNSVRDPAKNKVECGALEGYQATVTALKANEAVKAGTKITYQKEWFDL